MRDVDLTRVHYLTGPFEIETAEPGDLLLVDIQDVQPLPDEPWGFTGIFAKENGGGFLDEHYPKPYALSFPFNLELFADTKFAGRRLSGISKASIALPDIFLGSSSLALFIPGSWVARLPTKSSRRGTSVKQPSSANVATWTVL